MKLPVIMLLSLSLLGANVYADQTTVTAIDSQTLLVAEKNQKEGEAFLAANKSKPGVITLEDGLQYKIILDGKGEKPGPNDLVTVDYAGTLIDGTEFDSSYKRGEPATFPVSGVIPGWVEALQLMKEGSTWELYIPARLAYGSDGAPPSIGPNATLIFKIHLIDVKKR